MLEKERVFPSLVTNWVSATGIDFCPGEYTGISKREKGQPEHTNSSKSTKAYSILVQVPKYTQF